jgi:expansin (peptidoglycan-binding protein)
LATKTPEESKGEWDLAKIVAPVPGNEAFRPAKEGGVRWWARSIGNDNIPRVCSQAE